MRILTLTPTVFLLLCLTLNPTHAKAEVADRIVAVVNDDVITLSEVNEEGAPYFQALIKQVPTEQQPAEMQKLRKEVLSHLIDQHLIEQQAAKLEIKITDEDINQAIDAMLADSHATKEDFKKELGSKGITEAQYRAQFKGQMLQSRLINHEIRSKVVVTDEKINQYYKVNYSTQPGVSGYHILQMGFLWGDEQKQKSAAEAKEAAEKAKKELDGGKPFAEVASALSDLPSKVDGGDIGVFQQKELAPFMKEVVIGLKPGETSGVIETPTGYQILKLAAVQQDEKTAAPTPPPLMEVKKEIEEKLYKEEGEQLLKKWITELRTHAFIKENL